MAIRRLTEVQKPEAKPKDSRFETKKQIRKGNKKK